MKKVIITLALLNLVATSTASSLVVSAARPAAQAAGRNLAQQSTLRSVATESNALKPYIRNPKLRAEQQALEQTAQKEALAREQQITAMNEAFTKGPEYSHVSSMHTPSAIPLAAPKISHFSTNNLANQQAAQKISQIEANSTLNKVASFDEKFLYGGLASLGGLFGYNALKDEEIIDEAKAQAVKDVIPSIEEKIAPISDQELATLSDFIAKNGYADPKAAISNLYNNPNGENVLNALKNPVIAGTIAGTALVSYIYYEYLQYLERQKQIEKDKKSTK